MGDVTHVGRPEPFGISLWKKGEDTNLPTRTRSAVTRTRAQTPQATNMLAIQPGYFVRAASVCEVVAHDHKIVVVFDGGKQREFTSLRFNPMAFSQDVAARVQGMVEIDAGLWVRCSSVIEVVHHGYVFSLF